MRSARSRSTLLIGLLTLAGCGSKDDQPPTSENNRAVIGTVDPLGDLDPANSYDVATWQLFRNVGLRLYTYKVGSDGELEPSLADGLPEISQNLKEYTIKIRQGVTFADGTPVNAQAVKYSIDRVIALEGQPVDLVRFYVEKLEVLDDYKVKFTLKRPVAYFLALLACQTYTPVNAGIYRADKFVASYQVSPSTLNEPGWKEKRVDQSSLAADKLLGSGPYRFESITYGESTISEVQLKANPSYVGTPPKVDRITWRHYSPKQAGDPTSPLLAALKAGNVDVAQNLSSDEVKELSGDSNFTLYEGGGAVRHLDVRSDAPPFNNVKLRQALAAALDREGIVAAFGSSSVRALYSMVPQGLWSHVDAFKEKYGTRDLEGAKALLSSEGYSTSNKLSFELWFTDDASGDPDGKTANAVKAQLEETGMIAVTIKKADGIGDLLGTKPASAAWIIAWFPDYADPDNFLFPFGYSGSSQGLGYSDSTMDSLLIAATELSDRGARTSKYQEIQRRWAEFAPSIPLLQLPVYLGARKGVQLTAPGTDSHLEYKEISLP